MLINHIKSYRQACMKLLQIRGILTLKRNVLQKMGFLNQVLGFAYSSDEQINEHVQAIDYKIRRLLKVIRLSRAVNRKNETRHKLNEWISV